MNCFFFIPAAEVIGLTNEKRMKIEFDELRLAEWITAMIRECSNIYAKSFRTNFPFDQWFSRSSLKLFPAIVTKGRGHAVQGWKIFWSQRWDDKYTCHSNCDKKRTNGEACEVVRDREGGKKKWFKSSWGQNRFHGERAVLFESIMMTLEQRERAEEEQDRGNSCWGLGKASSNLAAFSQRTRNSMANTSHRRIYANKHIHGCLSMYT